MPRRRKPKSSTGDAPLPNESIFYGTTVDELVSAMDKEDGFEGHPEDSETESDSSEDEESHQRQQQRCRWGHWDDRRLMLSRSWRM